MSKRSIPNRSVGSKKKVVKVKTRVSKEDMVKAATTLFARKGYHGTSIYEIAEASGLKKASSYHHFESKLDILKQMIEDLSGYCQENIFFVLDNEQLTSIERLEIFIKNLTIFFTRRTDCAAVVLVGMEFRDGPKALNYLFQQYFKAWEKSIEKAIFFLHGKKSKKIANDSLTYLFGALVLRGIFQQSKYIKLACEQLAQSWFDEGQL